MTEMPAEDLAAWLTRIWDEEERLAREVADRYPAPWVGAFKQVTSEGGSIEEVASTEASCISHHIERYDPASVLARIAADRKILALHGSIDNIYGRLECTSCGIAGEFPVRWPCPTLRLLASPYADSPGYREEWKP